MDKAGKKYWEDAWTDIVVPTAVDSHKRGLNNYVDVKFHDYFTNVFDDLNEGSVNLLEIGCAKSAWLPYFAKEFGAKVTGLDYSPTGCKVAKAVLENSGVEGDIVCDDFFKPPSWMKGAFDVVVSFGVAEHFENTSDCIRAFSLFLKPGGVLVTNIPNMVGLNAKFQKYLDKSIYDIHVPLSCSDLKNAHLEVGLEVIECECFMFVNLGVVNIENKKNTIWYGSTVRLRSWLSKIAWICERVLPFLKPNRITSPYINCIARKSCD